MFIDIHTHITYGDFPEFCQRLLNRSGFDADILLKRMDREGIEKSCVLPLMNAEVVDSYGCAGNQEVLSACRKHPDRLIPFCSVEPRSLMVWRGHDAHDSMRNLLAVYRDLGCRGLGEVCGSVPVDDDRYAVIYEAAGELNMPLIFHFQKLNGRDYGVTDAFHLPGLEKMLKRFPDTVFIGHSMAFWSEIAGDIPENMREEYLKSPYAVKGRLWELFRRYPNLRGDISAGSGAFALSCDPVHGPEFLTEFQDQLYFGTDRFTSIDEPIPLQIPLLNGWKESGKISGEVYEKISHSNAEKLLNL